MLVLSLPASLASPAEPRRIHKSFTEAWSTSSFGTTADASLLESLDLSEHIDRCQRSRGAFFRTRSVADAVQRFLAPRVITILAVVALLVRAAFVVL